MQYETTYMVVYNSASKSNFEIFIFIFRGCPRRAAWATLFCRAYVAHRQQPEHW